MQFVAERYFKFGGIPLISRRKEQLSKTRLRRKRHSLIHAGRIVKLLQVTDKYRKLGKQGINVAKSWFGKLKSPNLTALMLEDDDEITLSCSSPWPNVIHTFHPWLRAVSLSSIGKLYILNKNDNSSKPHHRNSKALYVALVLLYWGNYSDSSTDLEIVVQEKLTWNGGEEH